MSNRKQRSRTGQIVRFGLLSLVPGYPIYRAVGSLKKNIQLGMKTLGDRNRELAAQRRDLHAVTYNEAIAKRTAESLPLEAIERSCVRHKRFFLSIAAISAAFLFGSTIGGNYFGTFLGGLFVLFCVMLSVKYEHRLWQMETGRAAPDKPLGGFRRFFATRGVVMRILSPRLF
ncbi:hypothetical protein [Paraburkholderia hospita]|uniref:hypothetical protein n=1 Tax=Paraburkholderia hospita TaxID=169430 RepID=UPI0008A7F9EE|nr:hypothetical protein [Paraburkholderia hospita]SEI14419.1 hypothetical protein SAMN05192544_102526 [Paraburkholderia hospita]